MPEIQSAAMLAFFLVLTIVSCVNTQDLAACEEGDLLLGVLTDNWLPGPASGSHQLECGDGAEYPHILWSAPFWHAVPWMLDRINSGDTDINLGNNKLGYIMLETCSTGTAALQKSLDFVPGSITARESSCKSLADGNFDVVGIVGTASSATTIPSTMLLGAYQIPVVSPWATSDTLSDKNAFPYFLRTVPPDSYQASALLAFIKHYQWNQVSIIYSDDDYGRGLAAQVRKEAGDICVGKVLKIEGRYPLRTHLSHIAEDLVEMAEVRVVLVFAYAEQIHGILQEVGELGYSGHFLWVFSDSFGSSLSSYKGVENEVQGSVALSVDSSASEEYLDWFKNLHYSDIESNVWLQQYWKYMFQCQLETEMNPSTLCSDMPRNLTVKDAGGSVEPLTDISLLLDATLAYGHALQEYIANGAECYSNTTCIDRAQFFRYLKDVQFEGANGPVKFDRNGNVMGKHAFFNFRQKEGKFERKRMLTFNAIKNKLEVAGDVTPVWPEKFQSQAARSACRDDKEECGEGDSMGSSLEGRIILALLVATILIHVLLFAAFLVIRKRGATHKLTLKHGVEVYRETLN